MWVQNAAYIFREEHTILKILRDLFQFAGVATIMTFRALRRGEYMAMKTKAGIHTDLLKKIHIGKLYATGEWMDRKQHDSGG
jgi:hypothetical protein